MNERVFVEVCFCWAKETTGIGINFYRVMQFIVNFLIVDLFCMSVFQIPIIQINCSPVYESP